MGTGVVWVIPTTKVLDYNVMPLSSVSASLLEPTIRVLHHVTIPTYCPHSSHHLSCSDVPYLVIGVINFSETIGMQ